MGGAPRQKPYGSKAFDPTFQPRQRRCSSCGRSFRTTAVRRMLCDACWKSTEREPTPATVWAPRRV